MKNKPEKHQYLSKRQNQVWRMLAFGLTDKQIARKLSITHKTAIVHVRNIRMKLKVDTRLKAALLWHMPELA